MKSHKVVLHLIVLTALLLPGWVDAQENGERGDPAQEEAVQDGAQADEKAQQLIRASRLVLIGAEVKTTKGEKLGVVEDLLIEASTGEVRYVVISADGFVGHRNLMAVPAGSFKIDRSKGALVLNMSREVLGGAPSFKRGEWPDGSDKEWANTVDAYYRVEGGQKETRVLD